MINTSHGKSVGKYHMVIRDKGEEEGEGQFFDIPFGFRLGKITEECPFQGPVFFGLT